MDKALQNIIKRQRENENLVANFSKIENISDSIQKIQSAASVANFFGNEKSYLLASSIAAHAYAEAERVSSSNFLRYTNSVATGLIDEYAKLNESLLPRDLIALSISSEIRSINEMSKKSYIDCDYKNFDIGSTLKSAMIENSIKRLVPTISTEFLVSHALGQFKYLSQILQEGHGFSEKISKTIRKSLGDWRGQIVVPAAPQIMYVEYGFDRNLTDYQSEVFYGVVSEVGLTDSSNDIDLFGPIVKDVDDRNLSQIELNTKSYARLYQLENRLRSFINDAMTDKYGKDWIKFLPGDVKTNLHEIQKKKRDRGEERTLIQCTDFSHYVKIILKKDLWREVFSPLFGTRRMEDVQESLNRLKPVRDVAMHCNDVSHEDWVMLRFETARFLSVIGWPQ